MARPLDTTRIRKVSYKQATTLIECLMNKTFLTVEQITDEGKMARHVMLSYSVLQTSQAVQRVSYEQDTLYLGTSD